jgi:hypothetical protein
MIGASGSAGGDPGREGRDGTDEIAASGDARTDASNHEWRPNADGSNRDHRPETRDGPRASDGSGTADRPGDAQDQRPAEDPSNREYREELGEAEPKDPERVTHLGGELLNIPAAAGGPNPLMARHPAFMERTKADGRKARSDG